MGLDRLGSFLVVLSSIENKFVPKYQYALLFEKTSEFEMETNRAVIMFVSC